MQYVRQSLILLSLTLIYVHYCSHFCYSCGAIIVRSVLRGDIQRALTTHYTACRLLDDIVGVRVRRR